MTYSIVARDKDTGELGVAVQSHYFQVGPVVPWAIAGVGAVATQSMVNVSFGPLGLDYLKAGYTAEQALKALLAADSEPQSRQVSIVDASGGVATHTGAKCIPAPGHRRGQAARGARAGAGDGRDLLLGRPRHGSERDGRRRLRPHDDRREEEPALDRDPGSTGRLGAARERPRRGDQVEADLDSGASVDFPSLGQKQRSTSAAPP